ncbi:MAG: hypothetical protein ACRERU_05630 [Methylococcales bacterium]
MASSLVKQRCLVGPGNPLNVADLSQGRTVNHYDDPLPQESISVKYFDRLTSMVSKSLPFGHQSW